jgi:hypothetical protein
MNICHIAVYRHPLPVRVFFNRGSTCHSYDNPTPSSMFRLLSKLHGGWRSNESRIARFTLSETHIPRQATFYRIRQDCDLGYHDALIY